MKKTKYWQSLYFTGKKCALNSLIFVLLGIFLWPNFAFASTITEKNIINLTNAERIKNNLPELKANSLLSQAALNKGNYIFETQTFAHDPNGVKFSDWIKDAGYEYSYVGENLAINFVTSEGAMKAWLLSPSHKKNILNEYYGETGVAVIENVFEDANAILVVQIFASPLEEKPAVAVSKNPSSILGASETKNTSLPSNLSPTEKTFVYSSNEQKINNDLIFSILFLFAIFFLILSAEFASAKNTLQFILLKKNTILKWLPKQTYKLQKHLKNAFLKTKENI